MEERSDEVVGARAAPDSTRAAFRASHLGVVLLLAVVIFLSRWHFAQSPRSTANFRDFDDETELTLTAADHFLGTSVGELHWPGATNQVFMLPLLGADALRGAHGHLTPERFAGYLSSFYREPWHAIWLGRILIAVLSSVGLATLWIPFRRGLGSGIVAAAAVIFVALTPVVWENCFMASAAGMAMPMACFALAIAMTGEVTRSRLAWVGVCCGLCLAARIVFVPVMPLVLVLAVGRSARPVRSAIVLIVWAILGFLLVCPFAWTDPVRFAKAVIGNYFKHGTPVGWSGALRIFNDSVPPLMTLLFVGVLGIGVRRGRWGVVLVSLLCVLALVGPSSHSPLVGPRYFVTMPLVLVVAIIAMLPPVATWPKLPSTRWAALVGGVVILLSGWHGWRMVEANRAAKAQSAPGVAAADAVRALRPDVGPVAVAQFLEHLVDGAASSASLRELGSRIEVAQAHGSRAIEFTAGFGFDPRVVAALLNNFNEKERSNAARYRAAAGAEDRPGIDLRLVGLPGTRRADCLLPEEAIDAFRQGKIAVLVLDAAPPADLHPAVEFTHPGSTDHFYLLKQDGPATQPVKQ